MNIKFLRTIKFFPFYALNFFNWIDFSLLDTVSYQATWFLWHPWVLSYWHWLIQGWIQRCSSTLRRTWLGFGSARVQARSKQSSFTTQGPSWSLNRVWSPPIRPSKQVWSAKSRMSLFLGMLRNKEASHPVDQGLIRFPLKTTQQMSVYNAFQLHSTSESILSVDLAQINLSQKEVNH